MTLAFQDKLEEAITIMKRVIPPIFIVVLIVVFVCGWIIGQIHVNNRRTANAESLAATAPVQETVPNVPHPTHVSSASQPIHASPTTDSQPQPTTNLHPTPPTPAELVQNLAAMHNTFTLVNESDSSIVHITRDQVLKIINGSYADANPSAITYTLGMLVDNDAIQGARVGRKVDTTFLTPKLVWIVSLSGILQQSAGPPGSKVQTSNELDVVLDAQSGTELFGFVWAR